MAKGVPEYLQARDCQFGLSVGSEGVHKLIQVGGGVAVDWGVMVGVCEDDLLCQAAHVAIAKPLS